MNPITPLVSVLMTAYNREKYIAEAIESVLASTYTNFELIIVDDCSKDHTVEIAKSYEAKDNRIKVYVNEKNLGQFPNRNKVSEYAKGEYIYYADSDDKIFSDGLRKLVNIMEANPEVGFGMYCRTAKEIKIKKQTEAIREHFFKAPFLFVGPAATILRRNFFESINRYPVEFGIPGDMYFNLKACCYSSVILIPFEFMYYRIHSEQELSNTYDYLYNNYKYLNHALKYLPLPLAKNEIKWLQKKNKRRFLVNVTKYFFKTFNIKKTTNAIKLAEFKTRDALQGIFQF